MNFESRIMNYEFSYGIQIDTNIQIKEKLNSPLYICKQFVFSSENGRLLNPVRSSI